MKYAMRISYCWTLSSAFKSNSINICSTSGTRPKAPSNISQLNNATLAEEDYEKIPKLNHIHKHASLFPSDVTWLYEIREVKNDETNEINQINRLFVGRRNCETRDVQNIGFNKYYIRCAVNYLKCWYYSACMYFCITDCKKVQKALSEQCNKSSVRF